MIAGFERATSGEILIGGTNVDSLPPYKRGLGMVFQHYALFPHLTVLENIAFPLRRRRVPKAEAFLRSEQVLELVGLAGYGKRRPRELSGGQQQRVALARAVVFNPPVLLMDEPLGALDKNLRGLLQREISRMHQELGITFIFVTHDQEEALALSDRIAVFNDGRIEQVGTAEDLYERPRTVFVAQFLGESSLFHGVATGGADGCAVQTLGTTLRAHRGEVGSGDPATLVVRPERIRLLPADRPAPAGNSLRGRVRQEIYLGSSRKLAVELVDGSQVLVRESAGDVSASRPGGEVWLTFRAEDAAVLPTSPSGAATGSDNTPALTAN
jgi:putative spermidine/putrescine transport system ATP-binding protein